MYSQSEESFQLDIFYVHSSLFHVTFLKRSVHLFCRTSLSPVASSLSVTLMRWHQSVCRGRKWFSFSSELRLFLALWHPVLLSVFLHNCHAASQTTSTRPSCREREQEWGFTQEVNIIIDRDEVISNVTVLTDWSGFSNVTKWPPCAVWPRNEQNQFRFKPRCLLFSLHTCTHTRAHTRSSRGTISCQKVFAAEMLPRWRKSGSVAHMKVERERDTYRETLKEREIEGEVDRETEGETQVDRDRWREMEKPWESAWER